MATDDVGGKMDGSAELAQLAELLRLGAGTGRQIALLRPHDAADINRLADEAERMAVELDAIALRAPDRAAIAAGLPN